ncbi:hypothetical protein P171DRAFT_494555 [Karstenula rhodostoma CBS 690.94]|uniref:Aminoglycoside phosphotransferase domain-containing protein n=1 Tax=Karstenula rhodostoma CBS 690.94 TaxID=1392251 RepID=A0A9P4PFV1_9PLEO|nr:hypothetical protein P171DRAFT_494555 [Karstenula rhodostoma CBS 690.94]
MDIDPPKSSWTPEMALRSKAQVRLEEWKTLDIQEAWRKQSEYMHASAPADLRTWTTLTLPYQAHSNQPLPSMKEIRGASNLDAINGGHHEAENLLFLAEKRPELRIPTVLAVWPTTEEGPRVIYCLMINFIEGIPLDDEKFAELPIHAQDTICAKVSSQIRYLRELPSEGYYGRVHGQGWLCPPTGIELMTSTSDVVRGPYKTYEEFISAIYLAHQVQRAIANISPEWHPKEVERTAKFRSIFPDWNPHEPKLTWIDPKIDNMIARQIKGDDGSEDWEVFLIDWECTGWYPAWVQGLQFDFRGNILIRDYTQPVIKGHGPSFKSHREPAIQQMMTKDFDPNPDRERLDFIQEVDWHFF